MARAPEEVNFWQPSAGRRAVSLDPGSLFLFKLHAPANFIVGGGFFVRYSTVPAALAWSAFAQNNGVATYADLRQRVSQYRRDEIKGDPEIGCNILNAPFFWDEADWIPIPPSWAPNIVQGKSFDSTVGEGLALWRQVEDRIYRSSSVGSRQVEVLRFGNAYLTQARLGQGAFRVLVTDAYDRRCAVTGERTLPVLEAAHIKPYSKNGPHAISNGLLLRSDLHTLFDSGYLTIDNDYRLLVSRRIREEFSNGREYYKYEGVPLLVLPGDGSWLPDKSHLEWHRENCFLG